MTSTLNDFVAVADRATPLGKHDVLMRIDVTDPTLAGIGFGEVETAWYGRILNRGPIQRYVVVTVGKSFSQPDLAYTYEDMTTGTQLDFSVKLRLSTVGADKPEHLRRMVHAFRHELVSSAPAAQGGRVHVDLASALTEEINQWLDARYRQPVAVTDLDDPAWATGESAALANFLDTSFGLDAQAALNVNRPSVPAIAPITINIRTETNDSHGEVPLRVRLGCKLQSGVSPVSAKPLSVEKFKAGISKAVSDYVSSHLSRQELIEEQAVWFPKLERVLSTVLAKISREPTGFLVQVDLDPEEANLGPYVVSAGQARFAPLGWSDDQAIQFSSQATLTIIDAGRFEEAFASKRVLRPEVMLKQWLKTALQDAINVSLHDIHRANKGYAALLTGWDTLYRDAVKRNVEAQAKSVGLEASAVIAKPDCDEMELISGRTEHFKALRLPALDVNATLDFDLMVELKITDFNDISHILNASKSPLDHIRNRIILPALARAAQEIGYVDFNFSKSAPDANGEPIGATPVDILAEASRAALSTQGIQQVGFRLKRIETEHWRIFKELEGAGSERVRFRTKNFHFTDDAGNERAQSISGSFRVLITGISGDKEQRFFNVDWALAKSGNATLIGAIARNVEDSIGAYFNANDTETAAFGDLKGPNGREKLKALINRNLNTVLKGEYGLSGEAAAIELDESATVAALAKIQGARTQVALDSALAEIEGQGKKTREIMEIEDQAQVDRARRQANRQAEEGQFFDTEDTPPLVEGPKRSSFMTSSGPLAGAPPRLTDASATPLKLGDGADKDRKNSDKDAPDYDGKA